jgi:hypothetical protein
LRTGVRRMDRKAHEGSVSRREMLKRLGATAGVAWAAPVLTSIRTPAYAQYIARCVKITDAFGHACSFGTEFFNEDFTVEYTGGRVLLAGDCAGTATHAVDDQIIITTSQGSFSHDYSHGCQGFIQPEPPTDITHLFQAGSNSVNVRMRDLCGGFCGATDLYFALVS